MSNKTFTAITKTGTKAWRYAWTGTGPFRVLLDGDIYDENYVPTSLEVHGTDLYEPPVLEVCEPGETVSSEAYPVRGVLQWFGSPRATAYNIYIEGTIQKQVLETGRGYYQSSLPKYANGTTVNATIMQVDANGNESASVPFQIVMFKYPDPPLIEYTYVAVTGTFTVDLRA